MKKIILATLHELTGERIDEIPEQTISFENVETMDFRFKLSRRLLKREFVGDDLDICISKIETP